MNRHALVLSLLLSSAPLLPTVAQAQESLKDAPEIRSLCEVTDDKLTGAARVSAASSFCEKNKDKSSASADPSIAGTGVVATTSWQGAFVAGLGNVLADRAKAEVEAWFEDLVRDELCELKSKVAGKDVLWFPTTCKLIKDERSGAGQQLASSMVADAIRADLQHLVAVVASYLETRLVGKPAAVAVLAAVPVVTVAIQQLASRPNPLLLLRDLAAHPKVRQHCVQRPDLTELTPACALVFTGMAVDYYGSVINAPRSNGRFDLPQIKELVFKVFAAGEFRCAVTAVMSGKTCDDTTAVIPKELVAFFKVADGADVATLDKLFAVFEDMVQINELIKAVAARPDLARTKELLVELDDLLGHAELLLWQSPPATAQALRRFVQASLKLTNRDYAAAALDLVAAAKLLETSLPEWASRMLPLVVDLAEAKDSSQVAAAFTRAAAPIGSWRLKRQKPLLSLTGFVGGALGYETPTYERVTGGPSFEGGWAAGLMAPVGFQVSVPAGRSAVGLLLSVVDVGQLTWSRLQTQEKTAEEAGTEQVPDADLASVFSPGLYVSLGLGNSPFVIGAGASFAPSLRAFTYDLEGVAREKDVSVYRFGAFLAVDVTLLPF